MTHPATQQADELRFLGENLQFWLALKERADKLDAVRLLREIAMLHAKVGFYEQRIEEMVKFWQATDDPEKR